MNSLLIFTICFGFLFVQVANEVAINKYMYEIRQGRCSGDRMVNEDITREATPYTTKKVTYTWRGGGQFEITCVDLTNMVNIRDGASVRIIRGGAGYSDVVLEMMSQNGKALHYHMELYGKFLGAY